MEYKLHFIVKNSLTGKMKFPLIYRIIEPILQNRTSISAIAIYHEIPVSSLPHWE